MSGEMKQYDDLDTSTRVCPCGASITWEGIDPRLDDWMEEHRLHCNGTLRQEVTEDGYRILAGPIPPEVHKL